MSFNYSWVFEPDPYSYDTSDPNSQFVRFMREQDEIFYSTFPEARRAAEKRQRLKGLILDYYRLYGSLPVHDIELASAPAPAPAPAPCQVTSPQPRRHHQSLPRHTTQPSYPSLSPPSTSSKPAQSSSLSAASPASALSSWGSRKSSRAATMRLSPLPTKRQMEKKPPLACLFCRGRKIACGAPLPGSTDKTCNQCQRRSLRCEYPAESRRGMRKKKVLKGANIEDDTPVSARESILMP